MVVTDMIEEGSHDDELLLRVVLRAVGREVVNAKMLQEVMRPGYMLTSFMLQDDGAHVTACSTSSLLLYFV